MSAIRCGAAVAACFFAFSNVASAQSPGFDGTYRAPEGGIPGNRACGTTRFGYSIRVSGGVATMQTVSFGQLQGNIGPDGSISIPAGNGGLSGKFAGRHFSGVFNNKSCSFALEYDK